jgi:hypothetical protein
VIPGVPGSIMHLTEQNSETFKNKLKTMGNILYTIAVLMIVMWAIGFLGFNAGGVIHILLIIAAIAILLRIIQGTKPI